MVQNDLEMLIDIDVARFHAMVQIQRWCCTGVATARPTGARARRSSREIPGARYVELPGDTIISVAGEAMRC